MTAIIGAQPPWHTGRTGLPEERGYVYRGTKPLPPEQRALVDQRLAELGIVTRTHGDVPHSRKWGWAATAS